MRAGAINEVVKLNLAVFARAASVHLSLFLARLSAAPSLSPAAAAAADRNQLSSLPSFHATGLRNPFILPSFLPSMSFSSAARPLTPRLLYRPFLPPSPVRRRRGVTHSPLFMRCRNKCPTELAAPTPSEPPSLGAHTFFSPEIPTTQTISLFHPCRWQSQSSSSASSACLSNLRGKE